MTRVVFLVPRRHDNGPRDRLWRVCRARWEALFPDWPIVEGYHTEGPWNRSAAINEAARLAGDWDVAVIIDADVMVDRRQAQEAVDRALATGKVTWAHYRWRDLSPQATERVLQDPASAMGPELPFVQSDLRVLGKDGRTENPLSWSCCMAVPRAVWDALGGMDERFKGWGGEDTAFAAALQGIHGWERVEGVVTNLWHPRKAGDGLPGSSPEYVTNMRLRDRYAMALRRDHRLHDRVAFADEAEVRRDMDNIRRADDRNAEKARAMNLPDWDDWWPTLEELIARTPPTPAFALIVQSGGDPKTWPQRSEYLRATLASLNEHLPKAERRVIWSDWGDEFREQLEAIAAEHGFYLPPRSTPEHRLGYTKSLQAKWRYITQYVQVPWVFLTEDDFTFDRDVDIAGMVEAMEKRPKVAQMALLRDAHEGEVAKGGILGHTETKFERHETHLEHREFFTCNPSLMRTSTFARFPWPDWHPRGSEAMYGLTLNQAGMPRGIWGQGEQWVTHLGWDTRAGGPY